MSYCIRHFRIGPGLVSYTTVVLLRRISTSGGCLSLAAAEEVPRTKYDWVTPGPQRKTHGELVALFAGANYLVENQHNDGVRWNRYRDPKAGSATHPRAPPKIQAVALNPIKVA